MASAAVPMAGDSVVAPENIPAAKPGSRPRTRATTTAVAIAASGTTMPMATPGRPSPRTALRNFGPTE
jgi:hypothetical protein